MGGLPGGREVVVYCQVGQRGHLATRFRRQAGIMESSVGGGNITHKHSSPDPDAGQ